MILPRVWRLCAVVAPVPVWVCHFDLLPAPEPPAAAALAAPLEHQRLRPAGKGGFVRRGLLQDAVGEWWSSPATLRLSRARRLSLTILFAVAASNNAPERTSATSRCRAS
eukprot:15466291-Alexandrium_andersonii.AAC.1